jgi:hypothetical protein
VLGIMPENNSMAFKQPSQGLSNSIFHKLTSPD